MNLGSLDLSKIYLIHSIESLPAEEWKDIKGFEGWYQISSLGRVKSLKRNHYSYFKGGVFLRESPKIMKNGLNNGYIMTSMSLNGVETKRGVHCLVAEHFIDNPCPGIFDTVDHISTIKTQNNYQNLRWGTRSQNTIWAQEMGLKGNLYTPKFNKEQVLSIFNDQRTLPEIAKDYGVDKSTISLIKVGKNYSRFTGKQYKHTGKKLLDAEVVVEIYKDFGTIDQLSEKYGVNRTTVHKIRNKTLYNNITSGLC